MANETPSRPPPFMANAILNFHFDYVTPSLTSHDLSIFWSLRHKRKDYLRKMSYIQNKNNNFTVHNFLRKKALGNIHSLVIFLMRVFQL